jgi:hypothetical protein
MTDQRRPRAAAEKKSKIHREDGEVREERFHHEGTKGTKDR